mgnify:CR=1 FL=1
MEYVMNKEKKKFEPVKVFSRTALRIVTDRHVSWKLSWQIEEGFLTIYQRASVVRLSKVIVDEWKSMWWLLSKDGTNNA